MEKASIAKSLRSSPLAYLHKSLGATFTVWNEMLVPARYHSNINAEHFAIRVGAGLTDMSGIHKVFLSGKEGFEFLNHTVTRDCSKVNPGNAVYTALLDDSGRLIDDAIVFHLCRKARASFKAEWLICLGAGQGLRYIQKYTKDRKLNIHFDENLACLLVQGPKALEILLSIVSTSEIGVPPRFQHVIVNLAGHTAMISRTSYSGEDGFEVFVRSDAAIEIWPLLLEMGADPVGFEALNIARIEAGLLFFGLDMTGNETPTELDLNFIVDCENHNFRGKSAFLAKNKNPKIKTVGMVVSSPNLLVGNEKLLIDGRVEGIIRSFARSEWLKKTIAIAHIQPKYAVDGQTFLVSENNFNINKNVVARVCSRRFYNQLA